MLALDKSPPMWYRLHLAWEADNRARFGERSSADGPVEAPSAEAFVVRARHRER